MRTIRLAAAAALALALPLKAAAHPLHLAGHFEDGTLAGWQQTEWSYGGSMPWVAHFSPGTPGPNPPFPATGNYQAQTEPDGDYVTGVLHREIAIPASADSITLRLWYASSEVGDMPTLEPGGQGQGLRIDVMSPSAPVLGMTGVLANPYATSFPSNAADFITPRTLTISVVPWRGQTVRLRVAAVSNTAPMVVGLDDVVLHGPLFEDVGAGLPGLARGGADWGDFDGDGDLDLALLGSTGAAELTRIYRNDGGTFVLHSAAPTGLRSGDIAWADADGDGDLDVLAAGARGPEGGEVRELLHGWNAGGVFSWTSSSGGSMNTNLAPADFDLDGDVDYALNGVFTIPGLVRRNVGGAFSDVILTRTFADSGLVAWVRRPTPDLFVGGRDDAGTPRLESYQNIAGSLSGPYSAGYPAVAAGVLRFTDFDADGKSDVFIAGRASTGLTGYARLDMGFGASVALPFAGLYAPAVDFVDLDADGDEDAVFAGLAATGRYARIAFHAPGAFTDAGAALVAVDKPAARFGDFDGDGDPDLVLFGESASGPTTRIYRNLLVRPNAPPGPPASAAGAIGPGGLVLSWGAASDDRTPTAGLTYNVRAGRTPHGHDLMVAMSDPVSGRRRVPREGNHFHALTTTIVPPTPSHATGRGPLFWSVQAVDNARLGGAWAPIQRFDFGGYSRGVFDVPADQGGRVRIALRAGLYDTTATVPHPITHYAIWRRLPAGAASAAARSEATRDDGPADPGALTTRTWNGRRIADPASAQSASFPPGTWEQVASVSALQSPHYFAEVPTLADSGATGTNWSVFVVTTHSTTPSVWWISDPDSGKSVDDIAPGVPQGLAVEYGAAGGNRLSWQPAADPDFQYWRVHRGATPDFTISAATLVASVATSPWHDPSSTGPGVHYKLVAVDHNGNASAPASPASVVGVDEPAPAAFALRAPAPSPFRGATRIGFSLPRAADVVLEVFDPLGRRVRTLARGPHAAGEHAVRWDGRGADGERLGAGLFLVRLRAGADEAVRRIVSLE